MFSTHGTSADDRLDARGAQQVLRRLVRDARPFRRTIAFAASLIVIWTLCGLAGPMLVRYAIDHGIADRRPRVLNAAVIGYVIVAVASLLLGRTQIRAVGRAGEGVLADLRKRVFDHLMAQPMSFYDHQKAGVLVARMTSDVDSMSELVQFGLQHFVSSALLLIVTLVVLAVLSWQLTLVCLLLLGVVAVASRRFQRNSNVAYLVIRERVGENLSAMQESIAGVRVIQAYGREDEQIRRFTASNRSLLDAHLRSVRISTSYFGLVEFVGVAALASIVGVGGWLTHRGSISLGTVAAFVLLVANLFEPVQQLSQLFNTVQSAGASLNKLYGLLDTEPALMPGSRQLPARGVLEVDAVSFQYIGAQQPALVDATLRIGDGERLALIGPTGAGKSTLAKLISRLYDPTSGCVRFAGVDLRDATTESLRSRIVVVPQEGFLFGGSIRSNIRLARPAATDAEIDAAVAAIGATEHFAGLGLDTEVRERGTRLSAGERQLVSLARAALVDPAVLVLDEATSNLDPGTEAEVERAMEHLMLGRTVIVVAHRLSTVRRADRIAVVDHGRLAELGTHDELEALGGRYHALISAWRSTS